MGHKYSFEVHGSLLASFSIRDRRRGWKTSRRQEAKNIEEGIERSVSKRDTGLGSKSGENVRMEIS